MNDQSYVPKGLVKILCDAMDEALPGRTIWEQSACARKMGISPSAVAQYVSAAVHHKVLYREKGAFETIYSRQPIPILENCSAPSPQPSSSSTPTPVEAGAAVVDEAPLELVAEDAAAGYEFDASLWGVSGEVIVYGLQEAVDGGHIITPMQQDVLLRLIVARRGGAS